MNAAASSSPAAGPLTGALAGTVPADATRVLLLGDEVPALAQMLKAGRPDRHLTGVDPALGPAGGLDAVAETDIDQAPPPLDPRSQDAVVLNHVLERLGDPLAALRRLAFHLAPGGTVTATVYNAQHHSVLAALLRGDLQPQPEGPLDWRTRRGFTYATIIKTMLDAGLLPRLLTAHLDRAAPALMTALEPTLRHLGVPPERAALYLNARQYLFQARPLGWETTPEEPMTFVVCTNSPDVLRDNLLSSPDLRPGTMHQVIVVQDAASAADGLNRGMAHARHPLVVGVHQDVYLPAGWAARFLDQYRRAERELGPVGVAGVYGTRTIHAPANAQAQRFGRVVDRHALLEEAPSLPAAVETLDELLLAVPRDAGLRYDPAYGFHFYGVDMACQARARGLAAVTLDAPCFHNSQFNDKLPQVFHDAAAVFRGKWPHLLPVATPSDVVR